MNPPVLYRYEAQRYSVVIDPDREDYGTTAPRLVLSEFRIIRETPCGCWIEYGCFERWVSNTSRKRLAHRTAAEALDAYRERKKAYVRHTAARLQRAQDELALAVVDTGVNSGLLFLHTNNIRTERT